MQYDANLKSQRIKKPVRFAITVESSDDLTDNEILQMEVVIEAQVCLLQKQTRGYRAEHVTAWQAAA